MTGLLFVAVIIIGYFFIRQLKGFILITFGIILVLGFLSGGVGLLNIAEAGFLLEPLALVIVAGLVVVKMFT